MARKQETTKTAGIGDEAVKARTGKTWPAWLKIIDKAGGRKLSHKQIVAYLSEHHGGLGGWWTQMVTVGYEQARGLRDKHEKPGGYEISASKTVAVPVSRLYAAWHDARTRRRWLPEAMLQVRKATRDKSMRIAWTADSTSVDVNFYTKPDGKSQVTVQHGKLKNATEAARKKVYWADRLSSLKALLEG